MEKQDLAARDEEFRRRGKEIREIGLAGLMTLILSPVFLAAAVAIKLEGLIDRNARGPILLREDRVSRGKVFGLLKFRTLTREATAGLTDDEHIATQESRGKMTRVGRVLHQWYLDELPQLWNIVRGDMFLIGTRPWPVKLYEREISAGRTWKRDLPAGLVGPVQSTKGHRGNRRGIELDEAYLHAYRTYPAWKLLILDIKILLRSAQVQLEHKGL